jgi:hypothetical protein
LHRRFTDVFGLDFVEQARMLTHPAPPKREEELTRVNMAGPKCEGLTPMEMSSS